MNLNEAYNQIDPWCSHGDAFELGWNAALDNQWQDIETAPKDETRISLWTKETDSPKQGELKEDWLLYRNRWIPIAVFDEDMGWCELIGGTWYQIKERVTHWQPRPRPPSKEKS